MKDIILFESGKRINDKWQHYTDHGRISLKPEAHFTKDDVFFVMGSCFAERIRHTLDQLGVPCWPDYQQLAIDPKRHRFNNQPSSHPHMHHFSTFSMVQDMERIVGEWKQAPDDVWEVPRSPFLAEDPTAPKNCYQDPYMRLMVGRTRDDVWELIEETQRVMREGFAKANCFMFTFGMTEVFRLKSNGRIASQIPQYFSGGGEKETEYHDSTFAENYAGMEKIIKIIRAHKPDAKIVMTVSPIPLARTFSGTDVVIANTQSKATLRAALGEILRKYPDVLYFPSYELVAHQSTYVAFGHDDGRHVNHQLVDYITQSFVYNYFDMPDRVAPKEPPQNDIGK